MIRFWPCLVGIFSAESASEDMIGNKYSGHWIEMARVLATCRSMWTVIVLFLGIMVMEEVIVYITG